MPYRTHSVTFLSPPIFLPPYPQPSALQTLQVLLQNPIGLKTRSGRVKSAGEDPPRSPLALVGPCSAQNGNLCLSETAEQVDPCPDTVQSAEKCTRQPYLCNPCVGDVAGVRWPPRLVQLII